jgi:DNA-binding MarR family transcriptional regulator
MSLNGTKKYGVLLDASLKVIKQDITKRFKSENIDLTPEQWTLLSELADGGELSQKELASRTFKDAPTISRIIDLLFNRGYIVRKADRDDRRKFLISLTKQGDIIYQQSAPMILEARSTGWEGLTDDDYVNLNAILTKITRNIQKKGN